MNSLEEIQNYLKENNYNFYPQTGVSFPYSDGFYQKKIEDNKGIKYFIEFVFYAETRYPNGAKANFGFMANLSIHEPHQTHQIHHLNSLDKIIEAEKKIEEFWKIFGNYYETN